MRHKKILTYSFELIVILITMLMVAYAWVNGNKELKTKSLSIKADSHYDLLISLDEGQTWITETDLNLPGNFEFKHEITGNGINMYIPSNKYDDGTPISFTTASSTEDYLEFSIMFKLAANVSVFLDKTSFISPAVGIIPEVLVGDDVERISSSGEFTRDLIASSVRVAFINNDLIDGRYIMDTNASLVWAPNKRYEINCEETCIANINSTNGQNYKYIEAANIPVVETRVNNLRDEIHASGEDGSAYGDLPITTIDINENNGVKKVTVRIWIEGNDRDNSNALTGGLFRINLQFAAIMKGLDNEAPEVSVNANTIDGFNDKMEYSTDYGLNWISYMEISNPTFNNGDIVLVRKRENAEYFASSYTTLNF